MILSGAPEQQLPEDLRKHSRRAHQEVDRRCLRRVQVREPDQLPAGFVDERQADVEDHEVEVRECIALGFVVPVSRGGAVHFLGLLVLDRLRAERDTPRRSS
jgi:Zn ribbon nucleic-acid-binding protein